MRGARSAVGSGRRGLLLAVPMLVLLGLPVVALLLSSSVTDLEAGIRHPLFGSAMALSLRTSLLSLCVVLVAGTPLAWWLSRARGPGARAVELLVDLPIIVPPAVVGIALLETFGRGGLLGSWIASVDLQIPFTTTAVVLAQIVVSAPFYIQGAAGAFRQVDEDLLLVARTLGQRPAGAICRVAVPLALPGIIGGAALCWARALGEFGATLLFAGNLSGTTQTMPLAIYTALESDVRVAVALSLALGGVGLLLLVGLRALPGIWARRLGSPGEGQP